MHLRVQDAASLQALLGAHDVEVPPAGVGYGGVDWGEKKSPVPVPLYTKQATVRQSSQVNTLAHVLDSANCHLSRFLLIATATILNKRLRMLNYSQGQLYGLIEIYPTI